MYIKDNKFDEIILNRIILVFFRIQSIFKGEFFSESSIILCAMTQIINNVIKNRKKNPMMKQY